MRSGSGADAFTLRLARLLNHGGVEATITWLPRWAEIAPQLLGVAPPTGTQIVQANSWNAFAFGGPELSRIVTVLHCVHDPAFAPYKTLGQRIYHRRIRAFERRSLAGATAVVAISDFTRRSTVAAFGPRPIEVVLAWVDTAAYVPSVSPRTRRGPFRLLFAGNWGRRKGTDLLPSLMRLLGPGFELSFTTGARGSPPQSRLPGNMRWVGPVADERAMIHLYQDCDAMLVPSRLEGFGYTAAEAMACGRPVIAFNAASLPEVVADGVTGRLVAVDDVAALADACRELAGDEHLAQRWGEAGRQRAVDHFSPARALGAYRAIYERVLASR